jgi:hypothetical protein
MKKKYIAPSIEVIKVQPANIIAESIAFYDQQMDSNFMLGRDNYYGNNIWGE